MISTYLQSQKDWNDLLHCIAQAVLDELRNDVKNSPVYSLIADESTDVSTITQMIIFSLFIKNDRRKMSFLDLIESEGSTAVQLRNSLEGVILKHEFDPIRWVAACFDGCSSFQGEKAGAGKQLQDSFNDMIYIEHCNTHRFVFLVT